MTVARLLPQRVFPKGTRTKMMRFWVTTDEHARMTARAVSTRTSMSKMVVDCTLSDDAPMTSGEARQLITTLIGARGDLGRVVLALRALESAGGDLDPFVLEQLRTAMATVYNATESMAQ